MSLYVEWLNQIKLKADYEWLTKSQRKAFNDIVERWPAEVFLCLYGPQGCGKSFIARLLVKLHGYVYTNELKDLEPGPELIVVDGEEYNRLMRPRAQMLRLKRVVILMRRPPSRDRMPRTEVALSEHDVKQFQHNLIKYGVLQSFKTGAEGTDLGQLLRTEAIKRGGTDNA
ncbi:hypothetical protein ES703_56641 [subsurface metagenome]